MKLLYDLTRIDRAILLLKTLNLILYSSILACTDILRRKVPVKTVATGMSRRTAALAPIQTNMLGNSVTGECLPQYLPLGNTKIASRRYCSNHGRNCYKHRLVLCWKK